MASPSTMCSSCLRAVQRVSRANPNRYLKPSNTSRRPYSLTSATSQSLYLDFLAPSTQKIQSRTAFKPTSCPTLPQRTFATAASPTATPSDPQPAHPILNPRTDANGNAMRISLSPRAAHRLSSISTSDANPNLALRVIIESGGCHGFQYLMSLTDLGKQPATEEDTVFEGDRGAKVVIDESSLELLNGSTVDYTMELIGSQFKITGIPGATSSCGCGTSFDIKL